MRAPHAAQAVGFYALAVAAAGQKAGAERRLQAAAEAHWDFWADETDHMYTGGSAINCERNCEDLAACTGDQIAAATRCAKSCELCDADLLRHMNLDCTVETGVVGQSMGTCFEGTPEMHCPSTGYRPCQTNSDCIDPAYEAASQSNVQCYVASARQAGYFWAEPCVDAPEPAGTETSVVLMLSASLQEECSGTRVLLRGFQTGLDGDYRTVRQPKDCDLRLAGGDAPTVYARVGGPEMYLFRGERAWVVSESRCDFEQFRAKLDEGEGAAVSEDQGSPLGIGCRVGHQGECGWRECRADEVCFASMVPDNEYGWLRMGWNRAARVEVPGTALVADCAGDFDESGAVTAADILQLLAAYGLESCALRPDIDRDCRVGAADLLLLLRNYGPCDVGLHARRAGGLVPTMSVTGFSSPAANGVYGLPPPNITSLARLAAAARDAAEAGGTDEPAAGVCFEGDPETAEMRCQSGGYKECTTDADCIDPAYDEASQANMHCYLHTAEQSGLTWAEPCADAPPPPPPSMRCTLPAEARPEECTPSYSISELGTNECAAGGGTPITSEEECRAAAAAIDGYTWQIAREAPVDPKGCVVYVDGRVSYNSHATGQANAQYQVICITGAEYTFYNTAADDPDFGHDAMCNLETTGDAGGMGAGCDFCFDFNDDAAGCLAAGGAWAGGAEGGFDAGACDALAWPAAWIARHDGDSLGLADRPLQGPLYAREGGGMFLFPATAEVGGWLSTAPDGVWVLAEQPCRIDMIVAWAPFDELGATHPPLAGWRECAAPEFLVASCPNGAPGDAGYEPTGVNSKTPDGVSNGYKFEPVAPVTMIP